MEACRACLTTEEIMVPLDVAFVTAYNLLTNLNVALLDAMPQYVCQKCSQLVQGYIKFRAKCITTETSLQEVILQKLKSENDASPFKFQNASCEIKLEVKDEDNDSFDYSEPYMDDGILSPIKNEIIEDIKPKKRKYKKRKCKSFNEEKHEPDEKFIKTSLSCGLCKKTFTKNTQLSEHIEGHRKDRKCRLCPETFENWHSFVGHRFLHIPTKEFKCHICDKPLWGCAVSSAISMKNHYMKDHSDGQKPKFTCEICLRSYDTPRKLRKHKGHSHSKKCFICDFCQKTYNNKQRLTSHLRCHSNNRSYVCELCGFASKHSGGLKDHTIRKHTPGKVKCKECDRFFANAVDRDKHVCNIEPKICPICGLQLPFSRSFNRHLTLHSTVKRYKCQRCPAAYKSKSALTAHTYRHDGVRPHTCPFCPQRFYTQSVLIKHKRIHTGEKPYVCKVCDKRFTGNNNLKVHMQTHGEYLVVKRTKPEAAPLFQLPPNPPVTASSHRSEDDRSIELV